MLLRVWPEGKKLVVEPVIANLLASGVIARPYGISSKIPPHVFNHLVAPLLIGSTLCMKMSFVLRELRVDEYV
jgi:hypothetical protein